MRYSVILYNDDYTTMEFVVETLIHFFAKSEVDATRIMLEVHHKGRGMAGTYIRDVAESKADQVEAHARASGHPLKCTAEPAETTSDPLP
jgi:ATP-dependent Clp protease adaptor protein ClpS